MGLRLGLREGGGRKARPLKGASILAPIASMPSREKVMSRVNGMAICARDRAAIEQPTDEEALGQHQGGARCRGRLQQRAGPSQKAGK